MLWAGSDDGLVYVTRDGGKTWTNVTPKGMPEWSRISQIDASAHDAGTAWLAVNRYQLDDYRPYAYVTTDFGATWRSIAAGLPADAFVRVVREDPVRRGLVFAGTETGVHVSFESGASWQGLQRTLPAVPVTDLVIKDADVVLSTQGRSFWILDDIAALRQSKPEHATAAAHLFAPSPAYRFGGPEGRGASGKNPLYGARLQYLLKDAPKEGEELKLEILDAKGAVIRSFSSKEEKPDEDRDPEREAFFGPPAPKAIPGKAGLNTFTWDLRHPEASKFKGLILWSGQTAGPRVAPGRYEARLTAAGQTQSQPFEVRKDPRLATSDADFAKQQELLLKIRDKLTASHDAITRLRGVRDQVKTASERAKGGDAEKAVQDAADALSKKLTAVEEALYQTKNRASQDPLNYPIRLNNKLAALGGTVASADAAPTAQSYTVYDELVAKIDAELKALDRVLADDVPAFNRLVRDKEIPAVRLAKP